MTRRLPLVVALALAAPSAAMAGQPPEQAGVPGIPLALVITYVDGRVVSHEGGPRGGGFWTPMFPRVPVALEPGRLPVSALKCDWKRAGDRLDVAVSVLLGDPHQQELPVAVATVRLNQKVTVAELTAFGVAPITLSVQPIAPVVGFQPRVNNRTAGLQVTAVDVVSEPIPGYRVSVMNLSSKGAQSFYVRSFQGGRASLRGRQGDPEGHVIMRPGGTYTFRWSMSSAPPSRAPKRMLLPIDEIEISSVLWDDGTFEGERESTVDTLVLNGARRQQLTRVVGILRSVARESIAPAQLVPRLHAQAETLPILATWTDVGAVRVFDPHSEVRSTASLEGTIAAAFQQVKSTLLDDLRTAVRRGAGANPRKAAAFMKEILEYYEAWLTRVSLSR